LRNVVHVTHEAVHKIGGIGTVLEGLINSRPYRDNVGRTLLVCPLFYPGDAQRLGPGGILEYSSLDHIYGSPYADAFRRIEQDFNTHLVYGRRPLEDAASQRRALVEVLLVDLRGIRESRVNELKGQLWEHYGLQSHRYQHIWEFEQYVQLAAPAAAAVENLRLGTVEQPAAVFAHEFMGVPTALALTIRQPRHYRTLFYAHEVAAVRRIVEHLPGHDVMFYKALDLSLKQRLYIDDVFGPQNEYFKHAVVEAARHCDGTLAVGNHVVRELRFLGRKFDETDINLAYNGVPATQITLEQRHTSRDRLKDYCQTLLGWRPDLIFTHVTRLVVSKAMWRDLDVLTCLDADLIKSGKTAVLLVLSTELPGRPLKDILRMEKEWDWPLAHREGAPDLTEGEARYYQWVQSFNARARNIHVVYINQFGFTRATCGERVPAEMEPIDIRRGSDLEFGLTLSEPFGISPLEPLCFGGVCVVSTSCGCAGFIKQAAGDKAVRNVVLADYSKADGKPQTIKEALEIGVEQRREAELEVAPKVAAQILKRLPQDQEDEARLLETGYDLARKMGWDSTAEHAIFPAIERATAQRRVLSLA
jgi:hypothetical protein